MSITSVGHNLLHALEWELVDYRVCDKKEKWDLDEQEAEAVEKWIIARIEDLKAQRGS